MNHQMQANQWAMRNHETRSVKNRRITPPLRLSSLITTRFSRRSRKMRSARMLPWVMSASGLPRDNSSQGMVAQRSMSIHGKA